MGGDGGVVRVGVFVDEKEKTPKTEFTETNMRPSQGDVDYGVRSCGVDVPTSGFLP